MKRIIRNIFLLFELVVFCFSGMITTVFGAYYFVMKEPRGQNYLEFLSLMEQSRVWSFALILVISGLACAWLGLKQVKKMED